MESVISVSGRGHYSRRSLVVTAIAVLLLLLAGGTAFAALIPTVSVKANKSIGAMLPATTAFYVSANINPSGATRDNLNRITNAFTSQPGWSNVWSQLGRWAARGPCSRRNCTNQVHARITDIIHRLGQDDAVAMTDTRGISSVKPDQAVLRRDFVALAPLDTTVTMLQALTGNNGFHSAEKSQSYHGVTIYTRNFQKDFFSYSPAVRSTAVHDYYQAVVDNWIVLGLDPQAIFPVVDTVQGKRPALSSTSAYRDLMARLTTDHLGSFYLNNKALKGAYDILKRLPTRSGISASRLKRAQVPTAGTLTVDSRGFNLTMISARTPRRTQTTRPAGSAAALVGNDALALLSFHALNNSLDSDLRQLQGIALLQSQLARVTPWLKDLTATISGEADLIVSHPGSGSFGPTDLGAPALMWQVHDETGTVKRLRHDFTGLIRQSSQVPALAGTMLRVGRSIDGTRFYALEAGSLKVGFAVRRGWAIVSASIPDTLASMSAGPAQPLSGTESFKRGIPANVRPATTWYFNVQGLRLALEQKYVGSLGKNQQDYYVTNIRPYFGPIRTISGSAGNSNDGKFSIDTTIVDIG